MILGSPRRIVNVKRLVWSGARQIDGYFQCDLGISDVFHLPGDFVASLRVLFVELRDERFASLCI